MEEFYDKIASTNYEERYNEIHETYKKSLMSKEEILEEIFEYITTIPNTNSGISYPNMTDDPEGGQAHLFFQVQNDEHRIIEPKPFSEVEFQPAPWM